MIAERLSRLISYLSDVIINERPLFYVLIFSTVLLVYLDAKMVTSNDSRFNLYVAMSLLREKNTDLNEYQDVIREDDSYALEKLPNGNLYNFYPLGPSLIAIPFLAAINELSQKMLGITLAKSMHSYRPRKTEQFISAILCALAALLFYFVVRSSLGIKSSLALTAIFAFGTPMLSSASRALWTHTPMVLALTAVLLIFIKAKEKPHLVQYTGFLLAFSYISRPTTGLIIVVFSIYILLYYRRYFIPFILWASPLAIFFVYRNLVLYDSLFQTYYQPRYVFSTAIFEILAGNMISPARGLLVYCPIFLLIGYSVYRMIKTGKFGALEKTSLIIILLHWVGTSFFNQGNWWAGHCFGPRLLTDVMPFYCWLLVPTFQAMGELTQKKRVLLGSLIGILAVISIAINHAGASDYKTYEWNSIPSNVDLNPHRVWEWSDPPFLR